MPAPCAPAKKPGSGRSSKLNRKPGLVEKARVEIRRERDKTISELRQEFADLTVVAAEKVIGKSLDKNAHRQIIDQVLDESLNLKKN